MTGWPCDAFWVWESVFSDAWASKVIELYEWFWGGFLVALPVSLLDAFRVPCQGPRGEFWDSSWPCSLSSERLIIVDPVSPWCVWFLQLHLSSQPGILGWKDTRATATLGACRPRPPAPPVSRLHGHIQRILSLKEDVIFGLEVRCRNYRGSRSHSLPYPWFSWLKEEAMGLNVFLALASKHMGEKSSVGFLLLQRHIMRPFWIPHSEVGYGIGKDKYF